MGNNCAVVVGAGTGTGAEVAKMFANDGYRVVVARRTAAALEPLVDEIEGAGGTALAVGADASDENQVRELFDRAESEFGSPGFVLFNAAGFSMGPIAETSSEQFEEMWNMLFVPAERG